jgi:hypothetical protein
VGSFHKGKCFIPYFRDLEPVLADVFSLKIPEELALKKPVQLTEGV